MNSESNKPPLTGSCLCGSIQYSVDKIEKHMAHCHCMMCRKFHGAAFATYGSARADNLHWISGKDKLQEYVGENGTKRLFCGNCGSSLVFIPSHDTGEYVEFTLGTLDSEINNVPDAHIFTKYGACWYQITDDLPQYQEGRDRTKRT
ncbi:MAG: GFA family protein [Sedimenticola sp.]